jgi:hypothetical protein
MELLAKLKAFRQAAYNHLGKANDATFELTDAVLLTRNAYSLADLSLCPVFRRRWPSIYEALPLLAHLQTSVVSLARGTNACCIGSLAALLTSLWR